VSHDLKAPLRAIEGFARVLVEDYADALDETGRRHLARIQNSASRMGLLIDDLLRYSRIKRRLVERRPVALGLLLDVLCEELAAEIDARGLAIARDLAAPEVAAEAEGPRQTSSPTPSSSARTAARR
jgi:signal transduction histidine kinase